MKWRRRAAAAPETGRPWPRPAGGGGRQAGGALRGGDPHGPWQRSDGQTKGCPDPGLGQQRLSGQASPKAHGGGLQLGGPAPSEFFSSHANRGHHFPHLQT